MRWNHIAVRRNLKQFFFSLFIRLFLCQFSCISSITLTKNHNSVRSNLHAFQLVLLIQRFLVIQKIQLINRRLNIYFIIKETFLIDFKGTNCMPRSPLLHKLCENTAFISLLPFRRHLTQDLIADTSFVPVRNHHLLLHSKILFLHGKVN